MNIHTLPKEYHSGRAARLAGMPKIAPATIGTIEMRHWWLAGWNDADMECAA